MRWGHEPERAAGVYVGLRTEHHAARLEKIE